MQNNSLALYSTLLDLSKQNTAVSVFSFPLVNLFLPLFSLLLCGFLLVEWSCLKDFSLLAGELVLENLQCLKCTITSLTMVTEKSKKRKRHMFSVIIYLLLFIFDRICWYKTVLSIQQKYYIYKKYTV